VPFLLVLDSLHVPLHTAQRMDDGVQALFKIGILLPLIAAVGGWYIASRLATFALARGRESPIRRAAAQCIPLLALVLIAIFRHQPEVAIGTLFGASVATLSLVLGVVTFTAPPRAIAMDGRRRWALVLPATILIFLAGYQSQFNWLDAAVFAIEGIVILLVWGQPSNLVHAASIHLSEQERPRSSSAPAWLLVFAIGMAVAAGWWAVSGSEKLLERSGLPSMSLIAALLLGPAMVLPMIGTGTALSQRGLYAQAIDSYVAYVLLNLCAILPILIVAWNLNRPAPNPAPTTEPTTEMSLDDAPPVPLIFPILVWRVDCVMLLILGISLLPFSTSRWLPGRPEGLFLILLYVAYMILWRWGAMLS
jgi:Ca2+/Na+ antiporter